MPHLREWREPSTLHLGRSLRMALHDRPEGERHGTHIPLCRQLCRPCQMEGRAWESRSYRTLSCHLPLSPSLLFPKERANKRGETIVGWGSPVYSSPNPGQRLWAFLRSSPRITGNDRRLPRGYQGYGYPVSCSWGRPIFLYGRFVEESGTSGSFRRSPVLYISLSYVYTGERLGKPVGYRLSDGSTTDYLRGRPAQPREAIRKELDVRRLYRLLAPCPFASGIYYLFPTPKSEEPSTLQTHTGTDPAGE